ncbi:hypothetical protein [Enterobacter quasiroggenkampii]|uniref:hypothetical protein n=1 Tax=Enterobacter quasiroggenkampii TaxID=2497436 RepID=UPI0020763D68|nr:hypothetical protein [Enterobacter quasiroggenkampii]MCM7531707.1 hypothetical protein [Enterobacter quasiroggenkampii]
MSVLSSVERSRRKRTFSKKAGITDRRVPVRTEEDERELNDLLQTQLARFVNEQLRQADNRELFSPDVRRALEQVLMLRGSPDYITPHGALSHFMTAMLDAGLTAELAPAVAIYTAVYPTSVDYVLKSVPAKVSNYLCRYFNSQAVIQWTEENPDWQEQIKNSLKDGTFAKLILQIREAIGDANIDYRMLQTLRQLSQDTGDLSPEVQEQTNQILDQAPHTLALSPREWNTECNLLRHFILFFILRDLENRYGEMACPDRTYRVPFYSQEREISGLYSSGVVTFDQSTSLARDFDFGICIGWRYDSWQQFFYQISHAAVYLLNPRVARHGTLRVSALEMGVAVRYAEEMLERYLPAVSRSRVESPAGTGNAYDLAFQAARKLPDEVLRQIRSAFGSFGSLNDPEKFTTMTAEWLTPGEAELLCRDFPYWQPDWP